MDRQIDIDNPEFYFCFKTCIDNQYALHWTPYAYRNMLMRIFKSSLYFQCVFNDFQCVITLLRALSVALILCQVLGQMSSNVNLYVFLCPLYGIWGYLVCVMSMCLSVANIF